MAKALVGNASSEKQVKRAGETASRRLKRESAEVAEVVATTAGLRVLWRVLEFCGENKISYHLGQQSLNDTVFLEGHRNVGNFIKVMISKADPDAFVRMQKDATKLDEMIPEQTTRTEDSTEDEDDGN